MQFGFAVPFICIALCGGAEPTPETLVKSGYDTKEMDAAVARARREVDSFIKELANPTGKNHAVKAPIKDGKDTEHFWLTDVSFNDGQFEGEINNEPGIVKNVRLGQRWKIKKEEISDWMYMKDEKMYGNYTIRPLLKTMPKKEAEQIRSILAEPSPPDGDAKNDLKKLVGAWKIVSVDDGNGPKEWNGIKLVISAKSMVLQAPNGATKKMGDIGRIDAAAKPARIDLTIDGETGLGIYELSGDDLKLIVRNPGKERAKEFKGAADGILFILKREKQ